MADSEQNSLSRTNHQENGDERNDNSESVMSSERPPPDGHSPAPSPPPAPKKWVHFDESAVESVGKDGMERSSNDNSRTGMVQLPKPPVAPRRSNPQQQQRQNHDHGQTLATDADVAQISVSVEESPRLGKISSFTKNSRNDDHPVDTSRQTAQRIETRQFENGKIITEKKPENKHCAWVTIAHFDPYKMPKSLISDQLTMPVEDFVTAMEMLTNDFRFRSYTVLYRRLIAGWLVASLFILIILLLSGLRGLTLFILTLLWLLWTCLGVFVCLYIKKRINKGLHNCVASVNKLLLRYNLLVGMEDRGKMSCHKVAIPFVYMDPKDCLVCIQQMLAQQQAASVPSVAVDMGVPDVYANGRPATPQERAEELILKYSQSYVRALIRRRIRFPSRPAEGVRDETPLHCAHSYCLCQYLRKVYFERPPRKWYHRFFLDSDIPSHQGPSFSNTVVAYGYPPVIVG